MIACSKNLCNIVTIILKKFKNATINDTNTNGETALIIACKNSNSKIALILLEKFFPESEKEIPKINYNKFKKFLNFKNIYLTVQKNIKTIKTY